MNILLAGISAKFIHQNLAVDTLRLYAEEQYGISCAAAEYTINQPFDFILGELYRRQPDLLGFSCYLWNWERVRRLSRALKTVLPGTRIVLGGPEVSADPAEALEASGADFVLSGEGEEPFSRLCLALGDGLSLETVPSLTWKRDGELVRTPPGLASGPCPPALPRPGLRAVRQPDSLLRGPAGLPLQLPVLPVLPGQRRAVPAPAQGLFRAPAVPGRRGASGEVRGPDLQRQPLLRHGHLEIPGGPRQRRHQLPL